MLHIKYQHLSLSIAAGERGEPKLAYIKKKKKVAIKPQCKLESQDSIN